MDARSELLASYRKVAAQAWKKQQLIKAAARKGPKAIQTASETAAKAVRRRDVLEAKLEQSGIVER